MCEACEKDGLAKWGENSHYSVSFLLWEKGSNAYFTDTFPSLVAILAIAIIQR